MKSDNAVDLWDGALLDCAIWHGRSGDVERQFRYRAPYLALPLAALEADELPISLDGGGLWRLRTYDYGQGARPSQFIAQRLAPLGLAHCEVALVTMPRALGYGFNPVSFWLARDEAGLRAVLAEVSNTFGERHLYFVHHGDTRPISPSDRIAGVKQFHVSPFLPREGHYVFRFDTGRGRFGAWIDWIGVDGKVKLATSMTGKTAALTRASLSRAQRRNPAPALKAIGLIYLQAAKLALKGVKYRAKPTPLAQNQTAATTSESDHV